jgi:hypothetical protein
MLPGAAAGTAPGEEAAHPVAITAKEDGTMGKQQSVVCGFGTTLSQHWSQWIGGTVHEQEWRQSPEAGQGGVRRKIACRPVGVLLLVLSLGLCSFLPDAVAGDDHGCRKASLMALGTTPIHGDTFLCIDEEGVRARLYAKGLEKRNAYTIWFSYIDQRSKCAEPDLCGPDAFVPADPADLPTFDPLGVVGRLDSAVAPRNGKVTFAGRVRGLHLSSGSQVQLFMLGHGEAHASDHRARARQLLTAEEPALGAPNLGNFVDGSKALPAAVAIFNIP